MHVNFKQIQPPCLGTVFLTIGPRDVEVVLGIAEQLHCVLVQGVHSEGRVSVGEGRDGGRHHHYSIHSCLVLNLRTKIWP